MRPENERTKPENERTRPMDKRTRPENERMRPENEMTRPETERTTLEDLEIQRIIGTGFQKTVKKGKKKKPWDLRFRRAEDQRT
jgi:hypothetical protein